MQLSKEVCIVFKVNNIIYIVAKLASQFSPFSNFKYFDIKHNIIIVINHNEIQ